MTRRGKWCLGIVMAIGLTIAVWPVPAQLPPRATRTYQPQPVSDTPAADVESAGSLPASTAPEWSLSTGGIAMSSGELNPSINKALERLRSCVTTGWSEISLDQLAAQITTQTGISTVLDRRGLEDASYDQSKPLTYRFHRPVSLLNGLQTALDSVELTLSWKHGNLLLTTKTAAETTIITRTYAVQDLVAREFDVWLGAYDFDSFLELIETTIQPTTWKTNGGCGDCQFRNSLAV